MEELKTIEARIGKIEGILEEIRKNMGNYVDKDYCNLKIRSNGMMFERIEQQINTISESMRELYDTIGMFLQSYVTKDDIYKLVVILSVIFTIVNIIISIGIK